MNFTLPADIELELHKLWQKGSILRACIEREKLFPLSVRLRKPDSRTMGDRFDDVRKWIRALEEGAKAKRGFGYEIHWTEIDHRQLGRNRVPANVVVPTREDALRLIRKEKEALCFDALARLTLDTFPTLRGWLAKRPLVLLENAPDWERILSVVAWFRIHPRSGIYLRQIDLAGVDTKFIEARKPLFMELLDSVLGDDVSSDLTGMRNFEARYGLRKKPTLVRFRILDPHHDLAGLSDIATPVSQLAKRELPVCRVFVTENEVNGLAFPDVPESVVIFGLGYGLDQLAEIEWLANKELHYWGDLDTHGFAMLDRLRARYPNAQALLMDRATLLEHRAMWVREEAPHAAQLSRLTGEELALYEDLVTNRLGEQVRLEQERIGFDWVRARIERLLASTPM